MFCINSKGNYILFTMSWIDNYPITCTTHVSKGESTVSQLRLKGHGGGDCLDCESRQDSFDDLHIAMIAKAVRVLAKKPFRVVLVCRKKNSSRTFKESSNIWLVIDWFIKICKQVAHFYKSNMFDLALHKMILFWVEPIKVLYALSSPFKNLYFSLFEASDLCHVPN